MTTTAPGHAASGGARGIRRTLLGHALEFVQAARSLPGVRRIALTGSLLSAKTDPNDVGLLVTVPDDLDLAPLAKLSRRLQGRCQSLGRGADVFLLDAEGTYLGRICPWRDCRPGARVGCPARHCGLRPRLMDDRIRVDGQALAQSVVWPPRPAAGAVPDDVRTLLMAPLAAGPPEG